MDVGVSHLPTVPQIAADLATLAEKAGVRWFGVADSPHLYGAMYPTMQYVLERTSTILLGPMVTNPVTRHPSVHRADMGVLHALHPGRVFFGIGAGDSAVHSIGERPATSAALATAVTDIRSGLPTEVPILVAVSGPRAAARVPAAADGIVLGGGLDPVWLDRLAGLAEASAGKPLRRFLFLVSSLVGDEREAARARDETRASVIAFSRHGLAGDMAGKGVPADIVTGLAEMYSRYVFSQHAKIGSANADLLAQYPREEAYLFGRFALVGTAAEAARQVLEAAARVRLDGVFLTTNVPDPAPHIRRAGEELASILRGHEPAVAGS